MLFLWESWWWGFLKLIKYVFINLKQFLQGQLEQLDLVYLPYTWLMYLLIIFPKRTHVSTVLICQSMRVNRNYLINLAKLLKKHVVSPLNKIPAIFFYLQHHFLFKIWLVSPYYYFVNRIFIVKWIYSYSLYYVYTIFFFTQDKILGYIYNIYNCY